MLKLLYKNTAMISLLKPAGPTAEALVDMMTTGLIAARVETHANEREAAVVMNRKPIPQVLRKKLIVILGFKLIFLKNQINGHYLKTWLTMPITILQNTFLKKILKTIS